jgi:hypothetical protein
MLPLWLHYYTARSVRYFRSPHRPLPTLLWLLREIGQFQTGRDFLLVDPPRSQVFHQGEGKYLFYPNSHRQLASFDMRHGDRIHSVGFRYNDPLDPKSGVAPRDEVGRAVIDTGWMGVARLIESAVKNSPFFGKLQTVEVDCRRMSHMEQSYSDVEETWESTYDIWVETKRSWTIGWESEEPEWDWENGGNVVDQSRWGSESFLVRNFVRNQRILLARVKVERASSQHRPDYQAELVHSIEIYPDVDHPWHVYSGVAQSTFFGAPCYILRDRGRKTATTYGKPFNLEYLSMDGWVMDLPPHSELQMTYRR